MLEYTATVLGSHLLHFVVHFALLVLASQISSRQVALYNVSPGELAVLCPACTVIIVGDSSSYMGPEFESLLLHFESYSTSSCGFLFPDATLGLDISISVGPGFLSSV
jgi:hypothetical protein